MIRSSVVIDTNVLVAANKRDTHASIACHIKAKERLDRAKLFETVLLDEKQEIFTEYKNQCTFSGQDSGDLFFIYLHNKRWNEAEGRVLHVSIKRNPDTLAKHQYLEFPEHPNFSKFDPSDQKFVAVAIASKRNPTIVNATDTDWHVIQEHLNKQHGITVEQLCLEHEK